MVKGIDFPFDRVLHVLPNTHDNVKIFPNFILTQNKHNLILYTWHKHRVDFQ